MGQIVIQPVTVETADLERAALVLFPHRIHKNEFNVAVEWAAGTQTPIFCHQAEVSKFEAEGFGAYRFHRLDGYKEIDFQGGAVEFFPAKRKRQTGVKGNFFELGERLGLVRTPSYHVLIRPKNERPVLYLSSAHIDISEWALLSKSNPSHVVGSSLVTKHEWHSLSTQLKRKVLPAAEMISVQTQALGTNGATSLAETASWIPKVGSL